MYQKGYTKNEEIFFKNIISSSYIFLKKITHELLIKIYIGMEIIFFFFFGANIQNLMILAILVWMDGSVALSFSLSFFLFFFLIVFVFSQHFSERLVALSIVPTDSLCLSTLYVFLNPCISMCSVWLREYKEIWKKYKKALLIISYLQFSPLNFQK